MEWLRSNPIADMYGPQFLVLYAVVIGLTLAVCWWMLQTRSKPSAEPAPSLSPGTIKLLGGIVIAGLGGYKLIVALSKGRTNVSFLILMGLVSLVVLANLKPRSGESRPGPRGTDSSNP